MEVRKFTVNLITHSLIRCLPVRRSASLISQASTASTSTLEDNLTSSVEDIAENILLEASESFNSSTIGSNSFRSSAADDDDQLLSDEERIIREMDRDLPSQSNNSSSSTRRLNLSAQVVESMQPNESNSSEGPNNETKSQNEEKISIKLKFLNDEIKIDKDAHLHETILSFKRWVTKIIYFN